VKVILVPGTKTDKEAKTGELSESHKQGSSQHRNFKLLCSLFPVQTERTLSE
jgi:hypothetical protein